MKKEALNAYFLAFYSKFIYVNNIIKTIIYLMKNILILIFVISITIISAGFKKHSSTAFISSSVKAKVAVSNAKAEIPIVAWVGIPQEMTALAKYQEMKTAGITQSFAPFLNADAMEAALNLAQEVGIKLFISCPELISNPETTVKRFMNHPANAGYYLKDEPVRNEFPALGILVKRIKAVDRKHICYINLLPNYAEPSQLGANSYQEYLNSFIKEVPVQLLSFDHYPVIGNTNQSIRENWYENLEMIAKGAKKSDKPFWAFALTTAFSPYPIPSLASIRLQVYSDLAYGAQGIQYFTYWTLTDPAIGFNNAPITPDGKKTAVYESVQQMSKEIKALSDVFLGAKMFYVEHTGNSIPAGTKPLRHLPKPITMLKTDGIGAVVSIMKKKGKTFLIVVNRDFTASMTLKIKCSRGVSRVLKNGSSVLQPLSINKVEVEPGDIAIYRWSDNLN